MKIGMDRCNSMSGGPRLLRHFGMTAAIFVSVLAQGAPTTQYADYGDPSGDEQYVLELINRARANPPAEGVRLAALYTSDPLVKQAFDQYGVTPAKVISDFATYAPVPPLAMNGALLASSRSQANDQGSFDYQGHLRPLTGSNSSDPFGGHSVGEIQTAIGARFDAAGYDWNTFGENVYASHHLYAAYPSNGNLDGYFVLPTVAFAHAAFMVDWGVPALSHRTAILALQGSSVYKEAGIGAAQSASKPAGTPSAVVLTEDFGITRGPDANGSTPYIVGVVYTDNDADGFYTQGEGAAGVTVMPDVGVYFAVTSSAGGFAIPLKGLTPGTNIVTLTFTGGALGSRQIVQSVSLDGSNNVKADLKLAGAPPSSRIVNLSTRLSIGTDSNVGIAGFVIKGTTPKRVLIRVLGPSLTAFGVQGALVDPYLEVRDSAGALVQANDNWQDSQKDAINAANLAPPNNLDCALIVTLPPGPSATVGASYTAVVRGNASQQGVALVEVYDLDDAAINSHAVNVSTRGRVLLGDSVMIAGIVIKGTLPRKVVIRALGPTLTPFGVVGALPDPTIRVANSSGATVATNDDWRNGPSAAELQALNLAPVSEKEPALVLTLDPGAYTAIVSGTGNTTGVALVEVYDAE